MKYILTLIYILFTTSGLLLMKSGGDSLLLSFKGGITFKIGFVTLCGFLCYICSFLLWQKLLVTFDLSSIVPITTAIVQVIVVLMGVFIFKEQMSSMNILGLILVVIGVILMTMKK